MSTLRPFRAVRPRPDMASQVAALPYDVMNSAEARAAVEGKPWSFIRVDKAEVDLPEGTDLYSDAVYQKAAENLAALSSAGVTRRDGKPMFYIYSQTWRGRTQTGVVGCASVDEYLNDTIKKHEKTRADKEEDRVRHVDTCDANTGPIFLTYRDSAAVNTVVDKIAAGDPECDFVSGDVRNRVWPVAEDEDIKAIERAFADIDSLYIADGHHRCASAVRVAKKRREAYPDYDGSEEFNYFLCVCFPAGELEILDYNRVIADTNGLSTDELLARLGESFDVSPAAEPVRPPEQHTFGMYIDSRWYLLRAKEGTFDPGDPVSRLDVSILQNNAISPIFGISDPRTDKRIDFVGGIRGLDELVRRADGDMKVAFSMYPTTLDDLMSIADAGLTMPPKSTWFEPKLLSGLFIHPLS